MAAPRLAHPREFTQEEHQTWKLLFERQQAARGSQIVELFSRGIDTLGFTADRIPDLEKVNERLSKLTGFRGVPVDGGALRALLRQRRRPGGDAGVRREAAPRLGSARQGLNRCRPGTSADEAEQRRPGHVGQARHPEIGVRKIL